jgi:hypothetical protein
MRNSCFVVALAIAAIGCKSGNFVKQTADASADAVVNGQPDLPSGTLDLRSPIDDVAAIRNDVSADSSAVPSDAGRDQPAVQSPDLVADAAKADVSSNLGRDGGPGTPADVAAKDSGGTGGTSGHGSVLQHHNNPTRDGFYVDPVLSKAAIATLHVDPAFADATVSGPTYAQPLYLAGSGSDPDLVIVATEQNHVYAFDASAGGKPVWDKSLGTPLPKSRLATLRAGCGNIDPLGVTGTPVIDAATRTIYLDAMTIASANATAQHQVFALDASTGAIKSGWPVDLNSTVMSGSTTFDSLAENQRGALILLGGKVFVPFGGHIGDCGVYHGWIVGISTSDPTQVALGLAARLPAGFGRQRESPRMDSRSSSPPAIPRPSPTPSRLRRAGKMARPSSACPRR